MEPHPYLGDPQREKEIHHLLDQIQVPDESLSDLSSDLILGRSNYDPESQVYIRGAVSPGRHHEDFFENSINSTIAHTSPLSNMHLNEDSKLDSSLSRAFTPQQVSRMMDWSKNHITPAEGLFPQVSAPSMSIEGDIWESSPQETPLPTMIMRSNSSEKSQNYSKKSFHDLPILDLPTHEEKPSREVITFSPNNAEANWYFNPAQNSKRSSTNQSLKFPKNSFSTELMQGSALLAHAANHHFPSEISLSQVRENAPIFDEIHRLKSELTNLKVAFRSEQKMHEETKKELFQCSSSLQELENIKIELEDKNFELEEKIKFLSVKIKNPESLDQLRGKSLEYARMEIKQLKGYIAEKDKKLEDLKHALSQKRNMENNNVREKEIEELTYEITKLKLVNSSQTKQIKELNDKLGRESKLKDNTTGEMRNIIENYENQFNKIQEKIKDTEKSLDDKNKEIEKLLKNNKDLKSACESYSNEKNSNLEELMKAKETIEILQKQVSGTTFEKTNSADYEYQLNKIRNIYEKKIEDSNEETSQYKKKCTVYESKIQSMEKELKQLRNNSDDSIEAESKEMILMLQEEMKRLSNELEDLSRKNIELKANERKLLEEIHSINDEKEDIKQVFINKELEYKEQIQAFDTVELEHNRFVRKYEIETQNSRDLLRQYEEEMENLRFAKKQSEQLNDLLKRQLEDLKLNENTYKIKMKEEIEQDLIKAKNSANSLTAKFQFEKEELYQKLREKDQEISELKQDLEESYKSNEDKVIMDMNYFKEKIEKEKDEEIKKIKKIYNNQNATQTSFDYSVLKEEIKAQLEAEYNLKLLKYQSQVEEKIKTELWNEIKEKTEIDLTNKYKAISVAEKEAYDKRIEELAFEYTKKIENLKAEYNKNTLNMEKEFMNKVKSIEADYSAAAKSKAKTESLNKFEDLEDLLHQKTNETKALNKKIKELETQISEMELSKSASVLSYTERVNELDKDIKNKKLEIISLKESAETEKNRIKEDYIDKITQLNKEIRTKELEIESIRKNHEIDKRKIKEEFNERVNMLGKEIKNKDSEIETLKESAETEKNKTKEDYVEKINKLKQENLRSKREFEKEQKRLKDLVENATENARKDMEAGHLENINKEKVDWEKKEKNKLKIIQSKYQKDLIDREQVLKAELELEKNTALQELSDSYKQKLKQLQEDQKKYYEELKLSVIEEKSHEIEIKVRRELQDSYLKTILQLDTQHFQEKEKMREEFRMELSKRIEEIRNYADCDSSSFDILFSNKKRPSVDENSYEDKEKLKKYEQDLKSLTQEYKAYVLKSKDWLENSNKKREDWDLEKQKLEDKLKVQAGIIEKLQTSAPISPEMLSPEETTSLVLGIFKRSNQDSLVIQLLQQNSEFISMVHHLLQTETKNNTYSVPSFEIRESLNSARSYTQPKSVDVDITPMVNRPPRHNTKFSSPISATQNSYPWSFSFPYDN